MKKNKNTEYRFFPDTKLYQLLYRIYKFHMKKIVFRLTTFIAKVITFVEFNNIIFKVKFKNYKYLRF